MLCIANNYYISFDKNNPYHKMTSYIKGTVTFVMQWKPAGMYMILSLMPNIPGSYVNIALIMYTKHVYQL